MKITNDLPEVEMEIVIKLIIGFVVKKREELGYTQSVAAYVCDMKIRTYQRFERDENLNGLKVLFTILEGFDMSLLELMLELLCYISSEVEKLTEKNIRMREYYNLLNDIKLPLKSSDIKANIPCKNVLSSDFVHLMCGVFSFLKYIDSVKLYSITEQDIRNLRQILENCLTSR